MALSKIYPTATKKNFPGNGPTSSDDMKDLSWEIIQSLGQIQTQWNDALQVVIDSLPGGRTLVPETSRSSDPNAFTNGLDGDNVYSNSLAKSTDSDADIYYSSTDERPKTIKETLDYIYSTFLQTFNPDTSLVSISEQIADLQITRQLCDQIPAVLFVGPVDFPGVDDLGDKIFLVPSYNMTSTSVTVTFPSSYPGVIRIHPTFAEDYPGLVTYGWQIDFEFLDTAATNPLPLVRSDFTSGLPAAPGKWTVVTQGLGGSTYTTLLGLGYSQNDVLIYTGSMSAAEERIVETLAGRGIRIPSVYSVDSIDTDTTECFLIAYDGSYTRKLIRNAELVVQETNSMLDEVGYSTLADDIEDEHPSFSFRVAHIGGLYEYFPIRFNYAARKERGTINYLADILQQLS